MRLNELQAEAVGRGLVVRMPGVDPFEDVVDFMLVLLSGDQLGFVVSTGYKAGHVLVVLPQEAMAPGTRMLSVPWLKQNWNHWVAPEIAASEVEVLLKYPAPSSLSFD